MANVASGSVGPDAPEQIARMLDEHGVDAKVHAPAPDALMDQLKASIDAAPDLLITLAGDGTVRAAAELCGPAGPIIAPLPGGTMNMLPHAVYGAVPWPEALRAALESGEERDLGGGCIEGHRFLCAAILGSPARFAAAREAVRERKLLLAWARAKRALRRAFTGRLRYRFDDRPPAKAEAVLLICPIASKVMRADDPALEAAALDVRGAGEVLRLGFNALISDWRADPAVEGRSCKVALIRSAHPIPAILDGETVTLPAVTKVSFDPRVCRVLAPPPRDER
ncbi:diacylglycerol kinase family protein [Phenylobacterium sp.]|uniref:diacylglycerol/lipid kinase family protein n=1 Tax=Phenylobacterium sp. TaxID=1871053 RepID=UPI00301D5BCE